MTRGVEGERTVEVGGECLADERVGDLVGGMWLMGAWLPGQQSGAQAEAAHVAAESWHAASYRPHRQAAVGHSRGVWAATC